MGKPKGYLSEAVCIVDRVWTVELKGTLKVQIPPNSTTHWMYSEHEQVLNPSEPQYPQQ